MNPRILHRVPRTDLIAPAPQPSLPAGTLIFLGFLIIFAFIAAALP